MLSPEVLENNGCIETLKKNQNHLFEYATHLHAEFIDPERSIYKENMAGNDAHKFQTEYSNEIEFSKLQNLTSLFHNKFGFYPKSLELEDMPREETYHSFNTFRVRS